MFLGDSVERGKHQRQDDLAVLLYQAEDVLIVPEVKSALRYLKTTFKFIIQLCIGLGFVFLLCRFITWKWGLEIQAAICLKRGSWMRMNWDGSITSRISSISPRNITWTTNTEEGVLKPKMDAAWSSSWSLPHLFLCAGFRPVLEQPSDDLHNKREQVKMGSMWIKKKKKMVET